ncbi:MAG: class I tRNA ligase family protein, partial [Candidatus Binatia bacterium]
MTYGDDDTRAYFVTTAIPYVNATPHVGFAAELLQADVLARRHRLAGDDVRFLTGTDENSLKNARAATSERVSTESLVQRNAEAFRRLRSALDLSWDDFIRTSADARHHRGVNALWRRCAAAGDVYKGRYA